ncbi:hypothetical protein HVA01_16770 [Halovibrio variabilis]|uniref:Uncharacterized protein n=1 Tax=Halovibrio variabilis TaxID=31910 RepID=A0A511UPT7_9GAMM|nr:hypothetical protein HVA01_16770 [Halovibrio variabilis]
MQPLVSLACIGFTLGLPAQKVPPCGIWVAAKGALKAGKLGMPDAIFAAERRSCAQQNKPLRGWQVVEQGGGKQPAQGPAYPDGIAG